MNLLCVVFGHKMYFDTHNIFSSSTCKRCGHKESAVNIKLSPRMPKVKPPRIEKCNSCKKGFNGTNGNGYQPCSCKNTPTGKLLTFYATIFNSNNKPFHNCQLRTLITPQMGQVYPYYENNLIVTKIEKQILHLKIQ